MPAWDILLRNVHLATMTVMGAVTSLLWLVWSPLARLVERSFTQWYPG